MADDREERSEEDSATASVDESPEESNVAAHVDDGTAEHRTAGESDGGKREKCMVAAMGESPEAGVFDSEPAVAGAPVKVCGEPVQYTVPS